MEKDFDTALKQWIERVNKKFNINVYDDEPGRKYIRILENNSAFCFIEKANGNVLKPATYKGPMPHSRGNIYKIGEEGVNKYGALYLK